MGSLTIQCFDLFFLGAIGSLAAVGFNCSKESSGKPGIAGLHCQLLQNEELQVIIGDASRNGTQGTQYTGAWSLTSKHRVFNAFGNSYAGLLPGEIRGISPVLEYVDERTSVLKRTADTQYPVDVRAVYKVVDPYYIDHELTFRDRKDTRGRGCDFREVT